MGKAIGAAVAMALALPACGGDTGIVLEISMSPALVAELDETQRDFETLRIWVGHATDDPSFFRGSGDAFHQSPRDRAGLAVPFRYLLEPTGELADIGALRFAAAVGDDPDDQRLPFRIAGFDVSDAPMGFADGEVRVVALELVPPDGVFGTIDDECIVWGMNTGDPQRIAPDDDVDCDGAPVEVDCDDRDPSRNELDRDGDMFSSCAGDCMDDPNPDFPWIDPARVNPGAIDHGDDDDQSCDHVDEDCDGFCKSPGFDLDGSGTTWCGDIAVAGGVCGVVPADCDEKRGGDQASFEAQPEACNAADDACDGFLPPPLPCLFADPGGCHWGQVECDELRGDYAGQGGLLDCRPLPEGFSDSRAPAGLCSASAPLQCLEDGDPIGCAFESQPAPRARCQVSAVRGCGHDRVALSLPDGTLPLACEWLVVGGVQQAEWEIGFLTAGAPPGAPPAEKIAGCAPVLAVRAMSDAPSPRAVLLLVRSALDDGFGARPVVVHLDPESSGKGVCTGQLSCAYELTN